MMMDHALPGLTTSPDTTKLVAALVKAQAQFPAVEKGGSNTFGKYKYMRYSDICEALREALNSNGLAIPNVVLTRINGEWVAVGTLRHATGQFITSLCPIYLGVDKAGAVREDMQSLGSAFTYAKKYLLLGLVGAWAEDDDDGQKVKAEAPVKAQRTDKSLQIEALAKGEIEKAKSKADAQKTLDRIKLRVSERVCDPAVFDRMSALVSTRFQEA
jgi:hypothetical protein